MTKGIGRIELMQYNSLREAFQKMSDEVLGEDFYTVANDVYQSDIETCEAITRRIKRAEISCFRKIIDLIFSQ